MGQTESQPMQSSPPPPSSSLSSSMETMDSKAPEIISVTDTFSTGGSNGGTSSSSLPSATFSTNNVDSSSSSVTLSTTNNPLVAQEKQYTRVEVLQITQTTSTLLFIIDNTVYDVTKFIDSHPGGTDVMYEYVGNDATSGFEGVGHSNQARKMLMKYKVGVLVAKDCV